MAEPPPSIQHEPSTPESGSGSEAVSAARPRLHCTGCGGDLHFSPGAAALKCPYCGTTNAIPQSEEEVIEHDFETALANLATAADTEPQVTARCPACGAEVDKPAHVSTMQCPYCDVTITQAGAVHDRIRPHALLPFAITREQARDAFARWVASLWFAPSKLRKYARRDSRLQGLYVPYWTYDADTITFYRGQRGEHYWDTQTVTVQRNGKSHTETRRVRKTRWYPASGTVFNNFNDLLVLASHSLPADKAAALEPWDLHALVAYNSDYLAGFVSERYQRGLAEGFTEACTQMEGVIRQSVCHDIGGDDQRIHAITTERRNITFKHILLPVWISAYRFQGRVYRYLVNARTGEVQGERPWSAIKITLAILAALLIAAAIYLAVSGRV